MSRKMGWAALLTLVIAANPGCYTKGSAEPEPDPIRVGFEDLLREDWHEPPVDVLVVVDTWGGAGPQQEILARDFGAFLDELLNPQDPDLKPVRDLHVGVVSTDLGTGAYSVPGCPDPLDGDDGILQHEPQGESCDEVYSPFLPYVYLSREPPDAAAVEKLAADFGCIARLGTDGCGFEQQLEASYRALVVHAHDGGANAAFLRDTSILTLLFVTELHDCSAEDVSLFDLTALPYSVGMTCIYGSDKLFPVSRYSDMLLGLRESDSQIALGLIAGVPPAESACNGRGDALTGCLELFDMQHQERLDAALPRPACAFPEGCEADDCIVSAYPARRMVTLAMALGSRAVVRSICTDSYVSALKDLAAIVRENHLANSYLPPPGLTRILPELADCLCWLGCTILEELALGQECGEGKIPYGERSGHRLCKIPQVGSRLEDCSMECQDPTAIHGPEEGDGWWYDPNAPEGPTVEFNGIVPAEGATLWVECG